MIQVELKWPLFLKGPNPPKFWPKTKSNPLQVGDRGAARLAHALEKNEDNLPLAETGVSLWGGMVWLPGKHIPTASIGLVYLPAFNHRNQPFM